MNKIKEYVIGIITFVLMIIVFCFFMDNVYIFGAIYLIITPIVFLIYLFAPVNEKYREILKNTSVAFLSIGVISIFLGTRMITYGMRYIRYNGEILLNKENYGLYFEEISIYNESTKKDKTYVIDDGETCTEYLKDDEITTTPCIIHTTKNDSINFKIGTSNYMGKIEYKINDGDWIKENSNTSHFDIDSKYVGLFKEDYIYGDYIFSFKYNDLKTGDNTVSVKFREKEKKFIFKNNVKLEKQDEDLEE